MEYRKFYRNGETRIQVTDGLMKTTIIIITPYWIFMLSPVLILVSYRRNHQGVKNVNVKNWAEEGDKDFIKAK